MNVNEINGLGKNSEEEVKYVAKDGTIFTYLGRSYVRKGDSQIEVPGSRWSVSKGGKEKIISRAAYVSAEGRDLTLEMLRNKTLPINEFYRGDAFGENGYLYYSGSDGLTKHVGPLRRIGRGLEDSLTDSDTNLNSSGE